MEIICLHLYFLKSVLSLQNMVGSTQQETIGFARVTSNKNISIPPEYPVNVMAETSGKFSDLVELLRASSHMHLLIGILNASPLVVAGDTFLDRVGSIFTTGFLLHSKTRTGVQFNSNSIQVILLSLTGNSVGLLHLNKLMENF